MLFDAIAGTFSHDLAIDLGTANTLVYVRGSVSYAGASPCGW
jgi:rod shape-determining protein MreB